MLREIQHIEFCGKRTNPRFNFSARGCEAARQLLIPRDRNTGVASGTEACVWVCVRVYGGVRVPQHGAFRVLARSENTRVASSALSPVSVGTKNLTWLPVLLGAFRKKEFCGNNLTHQNSLILDIGTFRLVHMGWKVGKMTILPLHYKKNDLWSHILVPDTILSCTKASMKLFYYRVRIWKHPVPSLVPDENTT